MSVRTWCDALGRFCPESGCDCIETLDAPATVTPVSRLTLEDRAIWRERKLTGRAVAEIRKADRRDADIMLVRTGYRLGGNVSALAEPLPTLAEEVADAG